MGCNCGVSNSKLLLEWKGRAAKILIILGFLSRPSLGRLYLLFVEVPVSYEQEWWLLARQQNINELKEKKICQCNECHLKNKGQFGCSCSSDLSYIRDHDTCIRKSTTEVKYGQGAVGIIFILWSWLVGLILCTTLVKVYMDSEISAIMTQYIILDSQNEVPNHVNEDRA